MSALTHEEVQELVIKHHKWRDIPGPHRKDNSPDRADFRDRDLTEISFPRIAKAIGETIDLTGVQMNERTVLDRADLNGVTLPAKEVRKSGVSLLKVNDDCLPRAWHQIKLEQAQAAEAQARRLQTEKHAKRFRPRTEGGQAERANEDRQRRGSAERY